MPNRVQELFLEKHTLGAATLEVLSPDELESLYRIAVEGGGDPNRLRAMRLLVDAGDSKVSHVLQTVLTNRDEAPHVRAAAAAMAARLGVQSEGILMRALEANPEPRVRVRIASALGQIGTPASANSLARLIDDSNEAVRGTARFARSIVAAREGTEGFELPVPSKYDLLEVRRDDASLFTLARAPLSTIGPVFAALGREPYRVSLERDLSFLIACGTSHMVLLLTRGMNDPGEMLGSRPNLIGLVAMKAPDDGSYAVQWLIFSWPENPREVNLAVHRTDGRQVFFGAASPGTNAAEFWLQSLRGPGQVPVRLAGRFSNGSFDMTEAVSARRREPGLVPFEITPPTETFRA